MENSKDIMESTKKEIVGVPQNPTVIEEDKIDTTIKKELMEDITRKEIVGVPQNPTIIEEDNNNNNNITKKELILGILDNIYDLSTNIIKTSLPILRDLRRDDENELVYEVTDVFENVTYDEVLESLRDEALRFTEDAETIQNEMKNFIGSISNDNIDNNSKLFPFLYEVWCGDMYGYSEYDGLSKLKEDLADQLKNIDEDVLVNNVINKLEEKFVIFEESEVV